ncbi:signal peptidase complex subunit Spase12 [Lycorma delicatula]|uniref:signal peptidase complex subunit Spase12 n=1 Tax=Lycorma delicatula TaxID=130591 RepID=UPI003F511793
MDFLNSIPTHMDFDGQHKAERFSRIIISLFGVVGLVWGYIIQQFSQTVYIVGAGFVLASLVTIPPWPMYRRKPLPWQKPRSENAGESNQKTKKKK